MASTLGWSVLCLFVLLARLGAAQYGYNYDLNYYDDYSLYTAGELLSRVRWRMARCYDGADLR